jgi:hypothetical protein
MDTGTYVFDDGTGEWAGYSSSGRYTITGSGTSDCVGPPVGTLTIDASGPISQITND